MRYTFRNWLLIVLLSAATAVSGRPRRVELYYDLINRAEMAMLEHREVVAAAAYTAAFAQKFPNDKDLYNAYVLAFFQTDTLRARAYLLQLAYMGLEPGNLPDSAIHLGFFRYIYSGFDSARAAGKSSKMYIRATAIRSIRERDAAFRKKLNTHPGAVTTEDYIRDLRSGNAILAAELKQLIEEQGFPSFERVGFWDGSSVWNPPAVFWILYHQRPDPTMADSLLLRAVRAGDFRPDLWATIIAYRTDEAEYNYGMRFWRSPVQIFSDSAQCAQARASIFLEPMADYRRKWTAGRKRQESITGVIPLEDPYRRSLSGNIFLLNYFILPSEEERAHGM